MRCVAKLLPATPAVAVVMASMRFCLASDRGIASGSCEPVMTIGFLKPASINESAAAVNTIVSVPCTTMKAS